MNALAYIGWWILLSILTAATSWQLHAALVYLAARLIDSPYRPLAWSPDTLSAIGRGSIFFWGSLCLMGILYIEHALRESQKEGKLWQRGVRFFTYLVVLLIVSTMIPILF